VHAAQAKADSHRLFSYPTEWEGLDLLVLNVPVQQSASSK